MTIVIDTKQLAIDIANELIKSHQISHRDNVVLQMPKEIRGDHLAGRLLGKTANAMKQRRVKGHYADGIHYKKDGKIIVWDKDALLREVELNYGSKTLSSS